MKPILLAIDGDILVHQIAVNAERDIDWGDDWWSRSVTDVRECTQRLDSRLAEIKEETGAASLKIAFSGPSSKNWRLKVLPTYKESRRKQPKPAGFAPLRDYAMATYDCARVEELEADDVLGIMATRPDRRHRVVVWSIDKDLKTVPGLHWSFTDNRVVSISQADADRFHLFQTLTGDSTDGYPGCPGIGPKKAERILEEDCSWESVIGAYRAALGTAAAAASPHEAAISNARVARILRHGEWTEKGGVRLWEPPKVGVK